MAELLERQVQWRSEDVLDREWLRAMDTPSTGKSAASCRQGL